MGTVGPKYRIFHLPLYRMVHVSTSKTFKLSTISQDPSEFNYLGNRVHWPDWIFPTLET